jgi:hypothetical protein
MDLRKIISALIIVISLISTATAQLSSGVYISSTEEMTYELKLSDDYFILSTYKTSPAEFLQTIGGFYEVEDDIIDVELEFNSDYEKDSTTSVEIPYKLSDDLLIFNLAENIVFQAQEPFEQDLDGAWLFATRGPDTGQERRGEANARKTLKFLKDGRFQWIAYHTETMKFSGTGGGSFTSENGKYVEYIEFFSRDNSRVGAELGFDYEIKGEDWHHKGLNSKGEPMYEIWARR